MIIAALFAMLFGEGSREYFYIAEFENSINRYVDDKEQKKEIKGHIKDYQKAVKEYNKQHAKQINIFKKKNLDKKTLKQDYLNFFEKLMDLRKEHQAEAIEFRLSIQSLITDDEWQKIVSAGKIAISKADEKAKAKQSKKDKPADHELIELVNEYIADEEKNKEITAAYGEFKEGATVLNKAYTNINVVDNSLLVAKDVTKLEMEQFADSLNALRLELYPTYIDFLYELNDITNDKEWAAIMKDLNKAIKIIKEQ